MKSLASSLFPVLLSRYATFLFKPPLHTYPYSFITFKTSLNSPVLPTLDRDLRTAKTIESFNTLPDSENIFNALENRSRSNCSLTAIFFNRKVRQSSEGLSPTDIAKTYKFTASSIILLLQNRPNTLVNVSISIL
uniref:Uncharacterized protein n=1 Tax=Cucumis sativus TaxID=3659 RepID=A0A0A0KUI6_CUCSA